MSRRTRKRKLAARFEGAVTAHQTKERAPDLARCPGCGGEKPYHRPACGNCWSKLPFRVQQLLSTFAQAEHPAAWAQNVAEVERQLREGKKPAECVL